GTTDSIRSEPPSLPVVSQGRRIDLAHAGGGEWYFNSRKGIQHGLDLGGPGDAGAHEWIEFIVRGDLAPKVSEDGRAVRVLDAAGRPVLVYGDLHAADADGRDVDVRWLRPIALPSGGSALRLVVEGEGHPEPIRIRGVITRGKMPSTLHAAPRAISGT